MNEQGKVKTLVEERPEEKTPAQKRKDAKREHAFREWVSQHFKTEPDSIITDIFVDMARSADKKDRFKLAELVVKKVDPDVGPPVAVDSEVLAILKDFDGKRREQFSESP